MMPSLSTDGKKVVFNDVDNDGGHALVVEDFDPATQRVLERPTVIYKDANNYPGWPLFTPDCKSVVFVMGPASNFASIPPASFSSVGPVQAAASDVASSDLYIVEPRVAGHGPAPSTPANGFKNGSSYLPYPGRDEHLDFYPRSCPCPRAGTSGCSSRAAASTATHGGRGEQRRCARSGLPLGDQEDLGHRDLHRRATGRPEPPGVLCSPARSLTSGNIRAFAVLSPCKGDGANCESGIDCCGGSCSSGKCGVPDTCAGEGNRCTDTVKCCNAADSCLGGYCGFIAR